LSFEAELLSALGSSEDSFDIKVVTRRAFFYDFDGVPVRLWDGQGVLIDSGGNEYLGTIDAQGTNHHRTPKVKDPRDGSSPRYEFGLPHVDRTTFDNLKADQSLAAGRELTCFNAIFLDGEGLRPATTLNFNYKLIMQATRFEQGVNMDGGSVQRRYSAFVSCRTLEYGRSKFPGGTYTDVAQNARAALLGVESDSGCVFVAGNSQRSYHFV
tara:strand:- start:5674 stop:6309 length:636 start_codon:yes stop_codon:yes gene_type:complete